MSFKAQFSKNAIAFAAPAVAGQPQSVWDVALPSTRADRENSGSKPDGPSSSVWEGRVRLAAAGAVEKLSAAAELERERLRLTAEGITDFTATGDHAFYLYNGSLWRARLQNGAAKALAESVPADSELVVDKAAVQRCLQQTSETSNPGPSSSDPGPLLTPRISPDGRWVAFAVDGAGGKTAFVAALPSPELKLPAGGVAHIFPVMPGVQSAAGLSVGAADYLAQEEFGRMEGLWWSPDSSRLLLQCTQEEPLPPAAVAHASASSSSRDAGSSIHDVSTDSSGGSVVELPHPPPAARAALQSDMEREYGLSSTAERWADEDAEAAAGGTPSGASSSSGRGGGGGAEEEGAAERFRYYFAGGCNPRVFFAVISKLNALRDAIESAVAASSGPAPGSAASAAGAGSSADGGAAAATERAVPAAVRDAFNECVASSVLLWPSGNAPVSATAGAGAAPAAAASGLALSGALALLPLPAPGSADDLYVPRAHWLADSSAVVLQVLNRAQDCTELVAYHVAAASADAASPAPVDRQLLLRERAGAGGWLNVHDCCFMLPSLSCSDAAPSGALAAGASTAAPAAAAAADTDSAAGPDRLLLWASERSGFRHLYLYGWGPSFRDLRPAASDAARASRTALSSGSDADTGEGEAVCLRAVTSGPWPVESVVDLVTLPQLRDTSKKVKAKAKPEAGDGSSSGGAHADASATASSIASAAVAPPAVTAGSAEDAAIAAALHRASAGGGGAAAADALRRTAVIFQAAGQTPCESHTYAAPLLAWRPIAPQRLSREDPNVPLVAQLLQDEPAAEGAELPPPRYASPTGDGDAAASGNLWWFERETSSEAVAARIVAARELGAYAEHVRYCRHGIVRLSTGAGMHRCSVSPDARWFVDELSTAYADAPSLTLFALNAPALAAALRMGPATSTSLSAVPPAGGSGDASAKEPTADPRQQRRQRQQQQQLPHGLRGTALLPGTPAYAAARLLLAGPTLPGDAPPTPAACPPPKAPAGVLASAASAASTACAPDACACGVTGGASSRSGAPKSSASAPASGSGSGGCCSGASRGRSGPSASSSSSSSSSSGGPPAGRSSWSPAARRNAAKRDSRCCGGSSSGSGSSSGGGSGDFFSSLFGSSPSPAASPSAGGSSTAADSASSNGAAPVAEDLGPGGFKHVDGALWGTVVTRSGRAARSTAWPRDRIAASLLPFEASGPFASAGACAYAVSYPLRPAQRPPSGSAAAADSTEAAAVVATYAAGTAAGGFSLRRAQRDALSGGFMTPIGVITGVLPHPYAATLAYVYDAHRLMGEGSEWLQSSLAEDDAAKAAALGVSLAHLLRSDETGEYIVDDDDDYDGDASDEDAHRRHKENAKGSRRARKDDHDGGDADGDASDGSILDTLSRLSSRFMTVIGQAASVVEAAMGSDDDRGKAGDGASHHGRRRRHHAAKTVPVEPPPATLPPRNAVAGAFSMRAPLLLTLAFPAGLASLEAIAGDAKHAPVGRRRAVFHPQYCYNDDPLRQDAPPKPQRPAVLVLRTAPALAAAEQPSSASSSAGAGSSGAALSAASAGAAAAASDGDAWPVSLYSVAANDSSRIMFGAVTLPVLRRMREALLRAREAAATPTAAVFASCFGVDSGVWPAFGRLVTEALPPGSVETTWMAAPTILYVYGGPGVRLVSNDCNLRRGGRSCAGVFAKEGFVTAMIDGRGSTGRGTAFERAIRMRMGSPEADDQVAGLRQLAAGGIVHPGHVGVHGWSYGGYMSLRLMSQGKEQVQAPEPAAGTESGAAAAAKSPSVFARAKPQLLLPFRAGVSGAPVTDWRFYDTAYTERYLGLPSSNLGVGLCAAAAESGGATAEPARTVEDEAYDAASVLRGPQRLLNLAGRHLLMLHGTKDENVLPHNTEAVATSLPTLFGVALMQRHGMGATAQNFRLRWLPGQRHALRGAASTRRDNMTVRFLADRVLGVATQKEAAADD